jgi:threonine/homoserine/homoserine lactone efflux protein
MWYYLTFGMVLGLSAGVSPGPLLTLVISETLRRNVAAGVRVAMAPLVTDAPIIILAVFVLTKLSDYQTVLGLLSLAGGVFILLMGAESLRCKAQLNVPSESRSSLARGILANALSPHPYLFWISVGAPLMTRALHKDIFAPAAFLAGFYVCLIGSKIAVALLVGRSKSFLRGKAYIRTMRVLGLVLIALAALLFRDGARLLGLTS